jgi:hypothetical protein
MLAKELFSGLKATLPLFTVAPSVTSTRAGTHESGAACV